MISILNFHILGWFYSSRKEQTIGRRNEELYEHLLSDADFADKFIAIHVFL